MKSKKSVIPNIFTTLNIFCGFLAIIKILDEKIIHACWLIVFAGIFDYLDGKLARITKSSSDFGIEFDSLADIVSFGVAPSILLYHIYFHALGILGIIISFTPLIAGGFRLARFNIQFVGYKKSNFSGLPIPISAISFSSYVIFNYRFWDDIFLTRLLGPQIAFICLLMVSTIEYYAFPKLTFKAGKKHSVGVILILVSLIILILFPHETLYPMCVIYIMTGIVKFIISLFSSVAKNEINTSLNTE